jgi:2'-5' RNA ligase
MPSAGEAGIVVLVPEAEPAVGRWRDRYDTSARQGMPAHVTVLYPFLREPKIDDDVRDRLRRVCAAAAPFDLELRRTARFPATTYLAPEPADPFRALTDALVAEWPEVPPYGGAYDDVVPHLTIADDVSTDVMDEADADVAPHLPVRTRVTEAHLFVFDGRRWQPREAFPLGG